MKIQITPVQIFPNTATQIEFLPAEITLGVSARSQYILQDADGVNLASAWVAMTPEQYANWGSNDDYAVACLLQNLGLTPLTPLTEQLDAVVLDQRGAIATFEAEKTQYEQAKRDALEAKAAAEQAQAEALAAIAAAEAELQRLNTVKAALEASKGIDPDPLAVTTAPSPVVAVEAVPNTSLEQEVTSVVQ